ncbi:biotin-dependent carboxyltransferase family protein [Marinobacter sp. M216]|uniref:Biotin-dependent carboxyltransferase family protein n=1 Tax=Marinobacter albus TaxID=3030833 RepID=A0ABT7HAT9_9GAMM|nr:biotin-dependent carboxyltransferase family protein [Marinobacter sp. M216]MDK9556985.1 biotin-dependent carboxyltransferase family protein [Marinobacter sp. M216]
MSFEVLNPGMLTLIQDIGRLGYQHIGVTTGGPMDEHAFLWANRLLNNPLSAAQLEITFGRLSLLAHSDTSIAITGADLGARINNQGVQPWQTYEIKQGDRIDFSMPVSGLRAYLAVSGGLRPPLKLGSCATVSREKLGGLDGQGSKLQTGDRIPLGTPRKTPRASVPYSEIPDYRKPLRLGVIPGYQYPHFPRSERTRFFSREYEVSQNIDRMGYRLAGAAIQCDLDGIISEGIAYGAIQIPADGQPIVLMKDRQTIGGYPKIGSLSALGAGQLAQRGPGASVSFYPVDVADAEARRMIFNRRLRDGAPGIGK